MNKNGKAHWERRLARYGLSNAQLKAAARQHLPANSEATFPSHDPDLRGGWWNQHHVRRLYSFQEIYGMHRVPVVRKARQVPEWALNDQKVRILILHLYPRLLVQRRAANRREMQHGSALRKMAAITALVIYRAFRQCLSDKDIAAELGISRHAVSNRLDRLKREAGALFEKAEGGKPHTRPDALLSARAHSATRHFLSSGGGTFANAQKRVTLNYCDGGRLKEKNNERK